MTVIETHIVPPGISGIRFSDYARTAISSIPSRKGVKKAIKRGELRIDGAPSVTGAWIVPGQVIELIELDVRRPAYHGTRLSVVYEDDHIAVILKPAGIAVNGNGFRTVENALPLWIGRSGAHDALARPRPVHRLDSPTSGLLIIARTARALVGMGRLFESGGVGKRYRAVVIGKTPDYGLIDSPVEDRAAATEYARVRTVPSLKNGWLSMLDVRPRTGRTHQIRVHLSTSGYPILGDAEHGIAGLVLTGKGLFLSAVGLDFKHPVSDDPIVVSINEPAKFKTILDREARRWEKYQGPAAKSLLRER